MEAKKAMRTSLYLLVSLLVATSVLFSQTVKFEKKLIKPSLNDVYISTQKTFFSEEKGIAIEKENKQVSLISDAVEVPIENAEPFLAISAKIFYEGSLNFIKSLKIKCYDANNQVIEDWKKIEEFDLEKREENLYIADIEIFPKETKYFQYKLILNADNDIQYIKYLEFHFISPGATPEEEKERYLLESENSFLEEGSGQGENRILAYPRPAYVARSSWGASLGLTNTNSSRTTTTVTHLVLHHSAGNTYASDYAAVVRSYYIYHTQSNRWADIGYNWLVDPNGVVYQGRAWKSSTEENVIGAHNSGYNSNCLGLNIIGNYQVYQPTQKSLDKIAQLMAFLCDKFGLNPTATTYFAAMGVSKPVITGHKHSGGGTECPGQYLIAKYDWFRTTVKNLLSEGSNSTPVTLTSPANNSTNVSLTPTLSWQALAGATSYNVQVSKASDFSSNVLINTNVSSTTYAISSGVLSYSTKYYWRVKANNSTVYSSTWNFTTVAAPQTTTPFEVIWERSAAKGTLPNWFGTDTERGLAFHSSSNSLLVVSRSGGTLKVRMVNGTTGADAGELSVSGISGGTFALNDIETTWDGKILACNLTTSASSSPFKIYLWNSTTSTPSVYITYNAKSYRLGDNFTVYGNLSSNAAIYVPVANSNKVLRWLVVNGTLQSQTPTEITLSNLTLQSSPSVAPYSTGSTSEFYVNSQGINPTLFSSSGGNLGTINGGVVPTTSTSIKSFMASNQRFLLVFQTNNTANDPNGQNLRVVNITNSPSNIGTAQVYGVTPRLGNNNNSNAAGDVAYTFANNSYIIYVLATNNGIAAYRCKQAPLFTGETFVSMEEQHNEIIADKYELLQNYPNPFNPTTTIGFVLPKEDNVKICVYNIMGELIATVADARYGKGYHKVEFNAKDLSSGTYIYTIQTSEYFASKKMLLVK